MEKKRKRKASNGFTKAQECYITHLHKEFDIRFEKIAELILEKIREKYAIDSHSDEQKNSEDFFSPLSDLAIEHFGQGLIEKVVASGGQRAINLNPIIQKTLDQIPSIDADDAVSTKLLQSQATIADNLNTEGKKIAEEMRNLVKTWVRYDAQKDASR